MTQTKFKRTAIKYVKKAFKISGNENSSPEKINKIVNELTHLFTYIIEK